MNAYTKKELTSAGSLGGFTLVETLVAITVLLLVIIGPMTIAHKGIQQAYFATEQAAAVFLAQEAIEAVREQRDNLALSVFNSGSGDTSEWISDCSSSCTDTGRLYIDDLSGKYTNVSAGNSESPFTRNVTVDKNGDTVSVTVSVSWTNKLFGNTPREVKLQTWIYDQYKRYE